MKRRKLTAGDFRASDKDVEGVLRALEEAMRGRVVMKDPIMEQLRQCPEAFRVGEIIGKAFDSLKYGLDEEVAGDRLLPPSGAVIPPLA